MAAKLGPEGERFALATLLETIDARELKEKPQTSLKVGLLTDLLKEYTAGEAFLSYFPEVITSITNDSSKYS